MKMRLALRAKVNVGFAAALVLLLAIAGMSYQKISVLASNNEWVIHTHEVLEKIQSVGAGFLTVQTEGRGYLLTGDKGYVVRFKAGTADLRSLASELRELTRDNPRQQQRLDNLSPILDAWITSWEANIASRNNETQAYQTRTGYMNQCMGILEQMNAEERGLLDVRNGEVRSSSKMTLWIIFAGALIAILAVGVAAVLINRELAQRERSDQQVRALNETLEHRAAELEQLNQELESFHVLVEQARDYAILQLDPAGNVVSWNRGAQRIKGYSAEEIIGKHFSVFYPPEAIARGKPERELQDAAAQGSVEDEDWRVRKDGSRFIANVVVTALRDANGNLRGFSKVTRDVTERKRAEESLRTQTTELARANADLAATNHELEAFTYSVSHDLRAPLRQMDGFSRLLLEDFGPQLPEQGQHYLRRVREGAVNMGRLIDELLGFARIGRKELTLQPTGLGTVVANILEELKHETEGREIEWRLGELPFAECDPALVRYIFSNLLSNAVKYTRPRNPAVIEIGQTVNGAASVIFVRDNGVGFSMRHADKLFGVFQRLHRPEDFEGTGIGLATVQRIVHKHGGRIWAEAEIDKGATFYFTLSPADAAPAGATKNLTEVAKA
jgi:PAS domain S-box-containing protein